MWYVYFLESVQNDWTYVGSTNNLQRRFEEHNNGKNQSTKAYAPFKIKSFISVDSQAKARSLEKYFKTGSGIAWANNRLFELRIVISLNVYPIPWTT